jgi:2-oxoglutarate/2-oxoacid ferredoxin oxidoreductase subunit alpha
MKEPKVIELEEVAIRFSGDSGDGMQLTGTLFSDASALLGNDISTFPDYPSEIRAPQGTVGGVSGFQVQFGHKAVHTPGDFAHVLVAMNPAAVKANARFMNPGGTCERPIFRPTIRLPNVICWITPKLPCLLPPSPRKA